MTTFIIRRLIQSVIVFFLITILVFLVMRLLPGDPIYMIISRAASETATEMQLDKIRHEYGLDRNMAVQYLDWLGGVFRGDLGVSILTNMDVREDIFRRLPKTLHLGILTLPLLMISGRTPDRLSCRSFALLSLPSRESRANPGQVCSRS